MITPAAESSESSSNQYRLGGMGVRDGWWRRAGHGYGRFWYIARRERRRLTARTPMRSHAMAPRDGERGNCLWCGEYKYTQRQEHDRRAVGRWSASRQEFLDRDQRGDDRHPDRAHDAISYMAGRINVAPVNARPACSHASSGAMPLTTTPIKEARAGTGPGDQVAGGGPGHWRTYLAHFFEVGWRWPGYAFADFAAIDVAALVVGGDRDDLCPVEDFVGAYRHLPQAELADHAGDRSRDQRGEDRHSPRIPRSRRLNRGGRQSPGLIWPSARRNLAPRG